MPLTFTDKHEAFRARIDSILDQDILPFFDQWEAENSLPKYIFKKLGDAGIMGTLIPERLGGQGMDFSFIVVVIEQLMKRKLAGVGASLLIQLNTVCPLLVKYGSPLIHDRFLSPLVKGEAVAGLAVTEPTGGSDLLEAIQTSAYLDGDEWVISGEKMFITNATIADFVVMLVRTSEEQTPFSMSFLVVPMTTPGIEVIQQAKLGQRSSPTGIIKMNNCRIPVANLVGRLNHGFINMANVMYEERFIIGLGSIVMAKACLEETILFLKSRSNNGEKITDKQAIRHEIVTLVAELESCRAFAYSVADNMSKGKLDKARICMVKYALCDKAQRIMRRCIQLHGSYGLYENSWMDRAIRDIRVMSIYAGSSETMRDLASTQLIPKLYAATNGSI